MVTAEKITLQDTLKYEGVPLLTYRIEYPEFHSAFFQTSLRLVNRFYRDRAIKYQSRCETQLFKLAVEQYRGDLQNDYPVRMFEAILSYVITLNDACVVSLYTDRYEFAGGAHGVTARDSQTWNLERGALLKLRQLIFCSISVRAFILRFVRSQIKKAPEGYFEDYSELVPETFREDRFYCTEQGIVVYFQQYEIAPYSGGIREFLLPYSNCVLKPRKTCAKKW